jgi:poly-gamma-glutamate capsule biosynthesis protein CapA/YwtB (metallophosphatase superfamily)
MRSKTYRPVDLPRDARGLMRFPPEVNVEIERLTSAATKEHRWESNQDILFDLKKPAFWAYWIHKTEQPITRAMQGTSIEQDLRPFRRTRFELLPPSLLAKEKWTLSAVGDLMCTRGLENSRDSLYADVGNLVFGADITYANLESTLTTGEIVPLRVSLNESPRINVTPAQYETLIFHRGRRFDVVQLANNHILDCGMEGIETTLAQLQRDGIEQVGVNASARAAAEPRVTEHRGLKIGWVAHTFSVNFMPFPPNEPWRVNMTPFHVVREPDTSILERQIRRCRARGCDLVFVTLHWGLEFEFYPHPQQRFWAQRFAELGADLVLGHHPHVIQPVEIYCTAGPRSRDVPILYSVGNLTPVFSHPATVLSLVARLTVVRTDAGEARVVDLEVTPVALVMAGQGAESQLRLRRLADLQSMTSAEMQSYVEAMNGYADRILGSDWR